MLIRLLVAIVLFAHGVGHLLFVANSWGFWRGGEAGRSRLFSGLLGAGQGKRSKVSSGCCGWCP